jgi:cellulose synthase/poly-beta-1,6-N-acetylglucosamine synthase-like glycosyltransferase
VVLAVVILYLIFATWLSLYGFQALALSIAYLFHRKSRHNLKPLQEFPDVTVQLPVFNERYVVERVIDAAAALDWPRDKLHIQVLDDSTDETTGLARARAEQHRALGIDIIVIHRTDRADYKAGALQNGLAGSSSPYIAIFDADFCPAPDFLKQTIPALVEQPDVAWVQTRWTHLNEGYSALTHAAALLMDGHFTVEQVVRDRAGLTMIFNGSAGVWRRRAIDDAGGWQGDTLTEDADLSFRAQIAGWRGRMLPDVTVPCEMPVQVTALKQQYFRWSKGGAQTVRKLFIPMAKSRMPLGKKLAGLFHMSSHLAHPLIILLLVTWLAIIIHPDWIQGIPIAFMSVAMLGLPCQFLVAQIVLHRGHVWRMIYLPMLLIIGTGMALNNARGVVQGLAGRPSEFMRTPKFRMDGANATWKRSAYALAADPTAVGEAIMAGYAAFMVVAAWKTGNLSVISFLLLYVIGFAYVAIGSAMDLRPRKGRSTLRLKADA